MTHGAGLARRALATVSVAAAVGGAAEATSGMPASCEAGYAYSGLLAPDARPGIRTSLVVLRRPDVESGHVAAWVGIGGPGSGPGGSDQWLQGGYVAFEDRSLALFYEVALPRRSPELHLLEPLVGPAVSHRLAILESSTRPGSWQVWIDGVAVSPNVPLAGTHGAMAPEAVGESWLPAAGACNHYAWRFAHVQVRDYRRAAWLRARAPMTWERIGQRVLRHGTESFDVAY